MRHTVLTEWFKADVLDVIGVYHDVRKGLALTWLFDYLTTTYTLVALKGQDQVVAQTSAKLQGLVYIIPPLCSSHYFKYLKLCTI